MTRPQTEGEFRATRRWDQLDGLRTLSIAIVFVGHMGDHWWPQYRGALGVILFFVISGYLITSLLIREQRRSSAGRISLRGFYIRRIFRIAPLYYLALLAATALVILGFGSDTSDYFRRLPLLATFNGDLAIRGTFVHAWSIGVEEKFYIVWPILGFAIASGRWRKPLLLVALPVCAVAAYVPAVNYAGIYTAIVAGCLLAVFMHETRSYSIIELAITPLAARVLLVALVPLVFLLDDWLPGTESSGLAHVPFALAVTLAFPVLLIGNGNVTRFFAWQPLVAIGKRTYAIYLFHPFCIDVVNRVVPDGQSTAGPAIGRLVIAVGLTLAVAEVLFRLVEQPCIKLGRRLTDSSLQPGAVRADR